MKARFCWLYWIVLCLGFLLLVVTRGSFWTGVPIVHKDDYSTEYHTVDDTYLTTEEAVHTDEAHTTTEEPIHIHPTTEEPIHIHPTTEEPVHIHPTTEEPIHIDEDSHEETLSDTFMMNEESIISRSKFQKSAVDQYCSVYGHLLSHNSLYYKKHAIYDYNHHVVYCYAPKTGCTSLKFLFFVTQGLIPRAELNIPLDKHRFSSFVKSRNLYILERRINNIPISYKFVMMRNPLERVVSGFRDKIERHNESFGSPTKWVWARRLIFKNAHPDLQQELARFTDIKFSDFIAFWLNHGRSRLSENDHFTPIIEICQPCTARFDYYGNFNHFDRDAAVLIDKIGGSSSDLRQSYYSEQSSSTDQRMKLYYSTLTDELKIAVLKKLTLELEFYYTIFPEERDSHKQILDLNIDLDLPS